MFARQQDIASKEVIAQLAASFVAPNTAPPAWLNGALLESDPRNRAQLLKEREANTPAGDVSAIGCTVGLIRGDGDNCQFAIPKSLWRDAIQVVPGSGHLLASEQASRFNSMIRSFIADLNRTANPELVDETFGVCSGIAATQAPKRPGALRKEIVGSSNIKARYEPQHADEAPNYRSYETTKSSNPNHRGKLQPGTMPHKNSRFEAFVAPEPEAATTNPAFQPGVHPNHKGRIHPGTMPHKNARFELPSDDLKHFPQQSESRPDANENPHARGRKVPGSMPPKLTI